MPLLFPFKGSSGIARGIDPQAIRLADRMFLIVLVIFQGIGSPLSEEGSEETGEEGETEEEVEGHSAPPSALAIAARAAVYAASCSGVRPLPLSDIPDGVTQ